MPLLSHTQDPRLSRTVLEPVFYLVLLSLAHFLCSEVGNWRLPPLQLEQQRRNPPHTEQSSFPRERRPFCSSLWFPPWQVLAPCKMEESRNPAPS